MFTATAVITTLLLDSTFIGVAAGLILGGFIAYKGSLWFVNNVVSPIATGAGEIYDRIVNTLKSGIIVKKVKETYHKFINFIKTNWARITSAPIMNTNSIAIS